MVCTREFFQARRPMADRASSRVAFRNPVVGGYPPSQHGLKQQTGHQPGAHDINYLHPRESRSAPCTINMMYLLIQTESTHGIGMMNIMLVSVTEELS